MHCEYTVHASHARCAQALEDYTVCFAVLCVLQAAVALPLAGVGEGPPPAAGLEGGRAPSALRAAAAGALHHARRACAALLPALRDLWQLLARSRWLPQVLAHAARTLCVVCARTACALTNPAHAGARMRDALHVWLRRRRVDPRELRAGACTAQARHEHGTSTARARHKHGTHIAHTLCIALRLTPHTVHCTAQSEFEWSQGRLEIYMLAVGLPTCIFGAALVLGVVRPPPSSLPMHVRASAAACSTASAPTS